ncbi:hypothetical protein BD289DRAFT_420006 [Coniella lustricola]|uniref:Uncharacterized protein n=1 Tax=Coniella lustricola TaxID=2025994 RepID=A0A2T3ANU9_9PEZI|nr:hypothetical protein BD289DRAFT_420006 [Coniella lustricola]
MRGPPGLTPTGLPPKRMLLGNGDGPEWLEEPGKLGPSEWTLVEAGFAPRPEPLDGAWEMLDETSLGPPTLVLGDEAGSEINGALGTGTSGPPGRKPVFGFPAALLTDKAEAEADAEPKTLREGTTDPPGLLGAGSRGPPGLADTGTSGPPGLTGTGMRGPPGPDGCLPSPTLLVLLEAVGTETETDAEPEAESPALETDASGPPGCKLAAVVMCVVATRAVAPAMLEEPLALAVLLGPKEVQVAQRPHAATLLIWTVSVHWSGENTVWVTAGGGVAAVGWPGAQTEETAVHS